MAKKKHRKGIMAEAFYLVDQQGNLRARLDTSADGTVRFDLTGEDQHSRLSAHVGASGKGSIYLIRQDGQIAASLSSTDDGSTSLAIHNQNGTLAVVVGVQRTGAAQIELFDQSGIPVRVIPP